MRIQLVALTLIGSLLTGCGAIVVGGAATGAAMVHDRRSAGTVLDDQNTKFSVLNLLQEHPEIHNKSNISAAVYNSRVLLTGQAASPGVADRFSRLVKQLSGVKQVHNEIVIRGNASTSDTLSDSYLTSKVKLALFEVDLSEFDPSRVKVVSSAGTVYLMGLLTQKEIDAVTEVVRSVSGVKRVVRLFETVTI